jgi:hypothetical protein
MVAPHFVTEMFIVGGWCKIRTKKRVKIVPKKSFFALDDWFNICYIERVADGRLLTTGALLHVWASLARCPDT